MNTLSLHDVMAAVDGLRGELGAVRDELAALKAEVDGISAERAAEARERDAELTPETLVMLAAAVTSYLGVRVRIRSARLVRSGQDGAPAWARHGRAAIQTSHQLNRGH